MQDNDTLYLKKRFNTIRSMAKTQGCLFELTLPEWLEFWEKQPVEKLALLKQGRMLKVVRKDSKKAWTADNLQLYEYEYRACTQLPTDDEPVISNRGVRLLTVKAWLEEVRR